MEAGVVYVNECSLEQSLIAQEVNATFTMASWELCAIHALQQTGWLGGSDLCLAMESMCVLFKGAARVGGIGSSPKYPRLSSAIHLLLLNCLNQQIKHKE